MKVVFFLSVQQYLVTHQYMVSKKFNHIRCAFCVLVREDNQNDNCWLHSTFRISPPVLNNNRNFDFFCLGTGWAEVRNCLQIQFNTVLWYLWNFLFMEIKTFNFIPDGFILTYFSVLPIFYCSKMLWLGTVVWENLLRGPFSFHIMKSPHLVFKVR